MKNNQNESSKKYIRLQGADWDAVRDNMKLLYTYKSDKGNIKGIYTDGKKKYSHWMNDYEKQEYLSNREEN